jgi:hypothetical protein
MEWLEPWSGVTDRNGRAALEDELARECGLKATALARRLDRDDVLFGLADGKVIEVHLTWRGSPEPDPRWPRMQPFPSLAAWAEARMAADHQEMAAADGPYRLPPPDDGWFTQAYAVGTNRHLLRLSANENIREKLTVWRSDGTSWSEGRRQLMDAGARMRIEVFAGRERIDSIEFPCETLSAKFDRLPDGRWVVASARCWGETNARILAPDGSLLSRLYLGDGIADLQCDRMGGIWVSYFDEGIFGASASDPEEPPGAYGINRFRPDGTISWSPNPGFDSPVDDCYAMTVAHDGVWLYYYGDFPIVHVPFDGVLRQWRNDAIRGASLLAADGKLAVLLGGYEEEAGSGALLGLDDDNGRSEVLYRFTLHPDLLSAMHNGFTRARGSEIHFVVDEVWTILSVAEFAAGLGLGLRHFPS